MKYLLLSISFLFFFYLSISQNSSQLELNLNAGDSFLIEITDVSDTDQIVMGEEQKIKKTDIYSFILTLDSLLPNSNYYFRVTYKRFKSVFDRDGYIEIFDTDSITNTYNPEILYFKSLTGKQFFFEVNKKGDVLNFYNLENIFNSNSEEELSLSSLNMLQKKYGSECIQNIVFGVKFPAQHKEHQNAWQISDTVFSGILKMFDRSFTISEKTDSSFQISYSSNILTDPLKHMKTNNVYIVYNMLGKQSGKYELFNQSCFLKSSYLKQYISGSAGMKYSENSGLAYTWPIKITNTLTSKVSKINSHEK